MDFLLKQWRDQQQNEESGSSAKSPVRFLFDPTHPYPYPYPHPHPHPHPHPLHQQASDTSSALPLFSPEPSTKLSAFSPDSSSATTKMGSGYFSMGQRQELEVQALIYRYMLTGVSVPPELLHLLVKKTLLNNSTPYYLSHPLHHYPNFQPAMLQSGYWGRGAMNPEPGRCRRTDGKKWRCSRDVVSGHKYCERHIHRGRNRSRKPVEIPTPTAAATGGGGGILKTDSFMVGARAFSSMGTGGATHSGSAPFFDHFNLNQRCSESTIENNDIFGSRNDDDKSSGRILWHFFDDWPRTVQEQDNNGSNNASTVTSATSLSISAPGHVSSDFSLKLSTGNGDEVGPNEREGPTLNWGVLWGTNPVASMGGPLAEALRSSTSSNTSSPTSVLHQLQCGSTSEMSYIST